MEDGRHHSENGCTAGGKRQEKERGGRVHSKEVRGIRKVQRDVTIERIVSKVFNQNHCSECRTQTPSNANRIQKLL